IPTHEAVLGSSKPLSTSCAPQTSSSSLSRVFIITVVVLADSHPNGFCKLIVERRHRYILGAHVIGECSVEIIQMVAACMASGMRVEQLAELQLAYPTFTEAAGMAAQKLVRELGLAPLPQLWSDIKSPPVLLSR